jgi:hypothetical protein
MLAFTKRMAARMKMHWFVSPTGHTFYAVKALHTWRFIGKGTYIIKEFPSFGSLKTWVRTVPGFYYVGAL